MSASPETRTIIASSLDAAYRYALAAMVPARCDTDGAGAILLYTGEGATPEEALMDAVDAIHDLAAAHGDSPACVIHEGSLRTDEGYRIWGSLTLGGGAPPQVTAASVRIEQGEEGTWTVTNTRR